MYLNKHLLIALSIFFVRFAPVNAQIALADSGLHQRMIDSVAAIYRTSLGQQSTLYNGTEYLGYVKRPKGHPFFASEQMQGGSILYDGVRYQDSLLYDLVDDAVIIRDYTRNFQIRLVKDKISEFQIPGHYFVRLSADTVAGEGMETGFYERLYNGNMVVLVRMKKQINSITGKDELIAEYAQYNYYFIRKDNRYYRVGNKRALLDILSEKKGEIRKYLKESTPGFKRSPGDTITGAVQYFEQLKK